MAKALSGALHEGAQVLFPSAAEYLHEIMVGMVSRYLMPTAVSRQERYLMCGRIQGWEGPYVAW